MRIIIAVHHFPPQHTSGAELRAYRTATWLQSHGHDMQVICVEDIEGKKGDTLTYKDAYYGSLPVHRLSFNMAAAPDPFVWAYNNPWIGQHLHGYLSQHKPDVLHLISGYLMSGSTLRVAMELQIPTVLTLTDFWFLCPRITLLRSNGDICPPPFDPVTCARCLGEERRRYRIPGRISPGLMRTFWQLRPRRVAQIRKRMAFLTDTLNHVDAIISPSQFLRQLFIEAGVAAERIIFSRQGRDFNDLTPDKLSKSPSPHLRIGYIGQIAPHKGVSTLFEAVQQLPDAELSVKAYGNESRFPDYTRLLRAMSRQDDRLVLAGTFERTQISQVLQDIDIVVVPSIWYENSPNTILEAFAHRTPVIASNLGGMAELVGDGVNGLLFTPGDAASLASKLQQVLDKPDLLARLQTGIKPVKSVAQEMDELQEIYHSVLTESNKRSLERVP